MNNCIKFNYYDESTICLLKYLISFKYMNLQNLLNNKIISIITWQN